MQLDPHSRASGTPARNLAMAHHVADNVFATPQGLLLMECTTVQTISAQPCMQLASLDSTCQCKPAPTTLSYPCYTLVVRRKGWLRAQAD
jgi:hypothetical protein